MLEQAVLSLFLFVAVLNGSYLFSYALQQKRRVRHMRAFALLCLCTVLYLFGYLMEINSRELEWLVFWNQIQYLGLPFLAPLWMLVCLRYTETIRKTTPRLLAVLFLVPVVVFLARLTNASHSLYYTGYTLWQRGELVLLGLHRGPVYWLQGAMLTGVLLASTILYIRAARRRPSAVGYRLMVVASLIAYASFPVTLWDPGHTGLDFSAFLFPLSLLVMTLGLARYDVLLARSLARDNLFEQSGDAMILLDERRAVTDCNARALAMFPALGQAPEPRLIDEVFSDRLDLLRAFASEEAQDILWEGEGAEQVWESTFTDIRSRSGRRVGQLLSLRDVTDQRRSEEELRCSEEKMRQLATRDMLTGLRNRFSFLREGEMRLARTRLAREPLCFLMIDIDHFKQINDTCGHAAGDRVLQFMGTLAQERFRKGDIAARLGGDEFGVLLAGTDARGARMAAEGFRTAFSRQAPDLRDWDIRATVSIGIAELRPDDDGLDALMERADAALYRAKAAGRDRLALWEPVS